MNSFVIANSYVLNSEERAKDQTVTVEEVVKEIMNDTKKADTQFDNEKWVNLRCVEFRSFETQRCIKCFENLEFYCIWHGDSVFL